MVKMKRPVRARKMNGVTLPELKNCLSAQDARVVHFRGTLELYAGKEVFDTYRGELVITTVSGEKENGEYSVRTAGEKDAAEVNFTADRRRWNLDRFPSGTEESLYLRGRIQIKGLSGNLGARFRYMPPVG